MPSMKQIQNRLLNKNKSLNEINVKMANAGNSTISMVLRRFNQEKGSLARDIRKLERQLITEKNASKEKKHEIHMWM
jgi:phenylalanyl-tRNA synthetase alpha subunit